MRKKLGIVIISLILLFIFLIFFSFKDNKKPVTQSSLGQQVLENSVQKMPFNECIKIQSALSSNLYNKQKYKVIIHTDGVFMQKYCDNEIKEMLLLTCIASEESIIETKLKWNPNNAC